MTGEIPLHVERISQLGGTPYLGFAVQVHAALLDESWADPEVAMVGWDTRAIVAFTGTERTPAGIITYSVSAWRACFEIGMGYVLADWRRRGIYRAMWAELVGEARDQKISKIYGTIMAKNTPMLRTAAALGRRVESQNVVFDLALAKAEE